MHRVFRLLLVGVVALGLALATPALADTALGFIHNDRLHYVVHLAAGRAFSLCPCTTQLAQTQYARGMYHARSPHQVALLTTSRPSGMRAHLAEGTELAAFALRHFRALG